MNWSSILKKRIRSGVDNTDASATSSAGFSKKAPAPFLFSSIKKRRDDDANSSNGAPTNTTVEETGSGKQASVPFLISWTKKRREDANASKLMSTASGARKYIKALSVLIILIVILSIVIVGIAIMTASEKFDIASITENDIPLAIGAGIGQTSVMAALFSSISPMDLLEEIDVDRDKKQKEDERKDNNNNKNKNNNKKNKNKDKGKKTKIRKRGKKRRGNLLRFESQ